MPTKLALLAAPQTIRTVFPALSARPRSRWSSWQGIRILLASLDPEQELPTPGFLRHRHRALVPIPKHHKLAAASRTRTACPVHPALPTVCRPITPFRTSCGRPDPAAGAVCGAMTGYFRHCGQHNAHGSTAGQPRPFLLEGRDKQGIHWWECWPTR